MSSCTVNYLQQLVEAAHLNNIPVLHVTMTAVW